MEQQTGSKWEKEYVKAVYCHLAYLTYMQSTHEKCWDDASWGPIPLPWLEKNDALPLIIRSHLLIFVFIFISLTLGESKKDLAVIYVKECSAYIFF